MINIAHADYLGWGSWMPMGIGFGVVGVLVATLAFLALIALKGYALWIAAKRDEKWWFIALLIINTIGILELIYIFLIAKKWPRKEEVTSQANPSMSADNNQQKP